MAKYVEECLLSLKNQTCDRWHCLVCDDHSTDHSVAIIKKHAGAKIQLLENTKNVGYIKTLKRLIAAAATDVVGILDADDALAEDATAHLLRAYSGDDVGFVYSDYVQMNESFRHERRNSPHLMTKLNRYSALLGGIGSIKTFRKSVYYKTSGLDDDMLYAEDRDLIYKLEEISRPVFVNKVLYKHRVVAGSQMHDPAKAKIGHRNHVRARADALRRRKIKGWRYFLYVCWWRLYDGRFASVRHYWPRWKKAILGR